MSIHSVKQYQSEVEKIIHFGGTKKETAIRNAFYNLLNEYAKQKGLILVPEISIKGSKGKTVIPDGTLKDSLRQDWGYWESKDEADDIDEEIEKKFAKGYPKENILFEDSNTAVLFQGGNEIMRVKTNDAEALDRIIKEFIKYQRPEVENFHKAIELFKQDIPKVTDTLRGIILAEEKTNIKFKEAETTFWELCKESINLEITLEDIREMMIQHILTEDIFNTIFDETQFHRENNIAKELEQVILTFFKGNIKRVALSAIQHYYQAINAAAAQIADHHEKQKFLKMVYEIFYKGYNPKAADRLGVVYTPNEIVKFMIESTDYLLNHHFGKGLEDKGVEILDPATGTGTFITDIIDYLPKANLPYKYQHEIHANEIAILPYYIANLNIEYTYKQKMGEYKEFENLCFVDTLENLGFNFKGKQMDLFGVSAENAQRIKRQNDKKISVVIGNPPYNARQSNYNFQNANKASKIDSRIKETYIYDGTAQNQIVVYDMYTRFFRWASDRLNENGVIAFITNNSYINGRAFDGFRKCIKDEFQHAYFIDLGGNIRELSGKDGIFLNENHTIFGQAAAVGISIAFLIKDKENKDEKCKIKYIHPTDIRATRDEKLEFLKSHPFKQIPFETINVDSKNNWINQSDNDFDELLPLIDKNLKQGKNGQALFKKFSLGVASHRDSWVYDFSCENLEAKIKYFIEVYQKTMIDDSFIDKKSIAWDRELNNYLRRKIEKKFEQNKLVLSQFRPFAKQYFYFDKHFNGMLYQFGSLFNPLQSNQFIAINREGSNKPFHLLASNTIVDLHTTGDSQCLPLFYFNDNGSKIENITDWGLQQFQTNYNDQSITKENIFHYVYAVLHYPAYRTKYELNLKRDFPRIPFYEDFGKWAAWGKALMELHIDYETVKPYDLRTVETLHASSLPETKPETRTPKPKLKADKETGIIILDEDTQLTGVPPEAWQYKLGNRSALEWILDQYKEKKPKDPTIAEHFNTYRFADYKTQVIDLLKRVCTVSVETVRIVKEMEK
ncbi:MAG: N-6 DNA methylase [Bacteroidales bacterium]|nr:N-6 DNA methylase [Bacteroidales bacterium]